MTERHDTERKVEADGSIDLVQQTEQRALAGELALEMLHEIRNPLETLGYLIYLAAEEAGSDEKVRKYMGVAEQEMARMRGIARKTLGVAQVSVAAAPVDLVELAETALQVHRRTIEGKRIALRCELPRDVVIVDAQHGPLLQVLSNLIVNALEAMPDAGALSVRVRKRGDEVDLSVADNGHGIEEQHLARIGERYFTTKGKAGNGLGLAISKKIVAEHRGRMRVRSSVRPGRTGTVFKVSLPAVAGGRAPGANGT